MTEQSFTTNNTPDPIAALRKCPCCACHRPIGQFVNIVITNHPQHWEYPQAQNLITKEPHGATAILCDKCIEAKAEIKNLVELRNGEVILHPVEPEAFGICECGAELTEDEWEIFNGQCEECAIEE